MPLLNAPMSHECILKSLAALSAALLLVSPYARAQSGPDVQIFTSSSSSGPTFMPFERLPVAVSASVDAGYDTNVGTSSADERPSFYTTASINLSYSFGTERTRASISWGTGITYYDNGAGAGFNEYQPDTSLNMSLSHLVSERLTLTSTIYAHYGIEPNFFAGAGENRRVGNYFFTSDSISASYLWFERFSTVTTYSIGILQYEDEPLATTLDRYDHSISQQFRFMFLPMTTIVGQYGFSTSVYDVGDRDSSSHSFSLGIDQTLGPRTQASINAGAQLYSGGLDQGDSFGPYFSGSLSFIVGEKTSLHWNAQYSTQEANITDASTRKSFSTGLTMSYAITPRISSSLSAYYSHSEYKGQEVLVFDPQKFIIFVERPTFTEDSFDFGLNLSYSITPRLSANAAAHYTDVSSELAGRPYMRARFSGGLSYSF